jgi:hypothetical protein
VPLFARGNWHANVDYGNGYSDSIGVIISDWTVMVSGTSRSPYGTKPIDENWTILEITGSGDGPYEVIACYPDYVPTVANVASAAAYCLGINVSNIQALTQEPASGSWPSGRWVYLTSDYSVWWGGFTSAEINSLFVFQATGGWELWAEANGVNKANRFVKGEMTYTNNKTRFEMVNMVEVANPMMPWEQTSTFGSLALLKAATLVEEHRWNWPESGIGTPTDGGILVMTFTR